MPAIIAIEASPKQNGASRSLAEAALRGAASQGADTELVHLHGLNIMPCLTCAGGWGPHYPPGRPGSGDCAVDDDFAALQARLRTADGLVFCSPVYFADISEPARRFLDRLRRCDWPPRQSRLQGRPALAITTGDNGNGATEAAVILEKYLVQWLGMKRLATLAASTISHDIHLAAAEAAGALMAVMVR